ncbi:MAG: peptide deformylase [Cytophagales bacterium]|nr:peptide deformylase [Armatimonadota bacterium]
MSAALAEKYENIPFDDTRIVKYGEAGHEILRAATEPVRYVDTEIRELISEMGDIMYRAHGVGLAAPQVARSLRLLVYDAGDGLRALINPEILKMKGEQYEPEEGCLSIPGLRGVVKRAKDISVKALDGEGRPVRFRATDFEARVIQHEVDHLHGVLFIDLADPTTLHMVAPDSDEAVEPSGEPSPPAE